MSIWATEWLRWALDSLSSALSLASVLLRTSLLGAGEAFIVLFACFACLLFQSKKGRMEKISAGLVAIST